VGIKSKQTIAVWLGAIGAVCMSPGICDSVHIDGVESELVVRFGHSIQSHPKALEEVRRILRDHLNESGRTGSEAETAAE